MDMPPRSRLHAWGRAAARLALVVAFTAYAAAKFAGAQFVTAGGTLDKPVADLSGIELTWVYFGYSPLYSAFVAGGQLAAAALLAFDRTARLGAAALLPITANIVAVNFGYQIGTDTQVVSVVLLALNLFLLAGDLAAWKRVLWDETGGPTRPVPVVAKGVLLVAGFAGLWALFAGVQNAGRPPVGGEWLVESVAVDGRPAPDRTLGRGWRWVCFDDFGRLSVRTDRGTFEGRYTAGADGAFSVRYDPEPLPPVYPRQLLHEHLSPEDELRVMGEHHADFRWPVEMPGTWHRDGGRLVVTLSRGPQAVEWVLTPYTRPKW